MMTKRSPATPTIMGSVMLSTAAVATAASMALPPRFRICRPACAASGWLVTTMPCVAITSERVCAGQPEARTPRTAWQNAGAGVERHHGSGAGVAAVAGAEVSAAAAASASALSRGRKYIDLRFRPLIASAAKDRVSCPRHRSQGRHHFRHFPPVIADRASQTFGEGRGEAEQIPCILQLQLSLDIGAVGLDGLHADGQLPGDYR